MHMNKTTAYQAKAWDASISKTLRQTYMLLAMTIGFSGLVAFVSMSMGWQHPGIIITLVGFYGLLFAIHLCKNSFAALPLTFAFTGFLGYCLGPILNAAIGINGGPSIVVNAMLLTALVFFSLSGYILKTGKDMSFLSGFLIAGFIALLGGIVLNLFLQIPALSLAISVGFVIFSSAAILFETSRIVRGGETNYVLATVSLYVSIYNLFISLLSLMSSKE